MHSKYILIVVLVSIFCLAGVILTMSSHPAKSAELSASSPYTEQVRKVAKSWRYCLDKSQKVYPLYENPSNLQECIVFTELSIEVLGDEKIDTTGFEAHLYDDGRKVAIAVPYTKPQIYIEMPTN